MSVSPEKAWQWLSRLELLATVNMFHGRVRFLGNLRSGPGTSISLRHGLKLRDWMPLGMDRTARVTHWQPGVAIGWVEIDPDNPRARFPHSQRFELKALAGSPGCTLLINELRGSLNLPLPAINSRLDYLFGRWWVGWVLGRECQTLKRHIESNLI